jgi:hypothetical protein
VADDVIGYPGAPPDWYADPAGGPGKRWWDGYTWSDAVVLPSPSYQSPGQSAPPSSLPAYPGPAMPGYGSPAGPGTGYQAPWPGATTFGSPSSWLDSELRMARQARIAVVVVGVYFLWTFIAIRVDRKLYRSIGIEIHKANVAAQEGRPTPKFVLANHSNAGVSALGGIIGLATIAAVVLSCIWLHRAASTARTLGYPAKHSPGWGVGCWFVPVVALWMPYQTLRDCLARDDPNRARVGRFWFFFVGQGILLTAAFFAAVYSTGAAVVFCVPGVLFSIGTIVTAPRVVAAIEASHRAALGRSGPATPVSG